MQTVAAFFPLKWMAQGIRSVFLPDSFQLQDPAVLGVWCIGGLLVCLRTFRWRDE